MQTPRPSAFDQKKRIAAIWLISLTALFLITLSGPLWVDGDGVHEGIEIAGLVLVFFAILGRLWSILFIGAKKNEELVTIGPYSMTRNPLYFFSLTGIAGIGLMFGSLTATAAMTAAFYVVFHYTSLREAAFLRGKFGTDYDAYAERTPLILPNPKLYDSPAEVTFSQRALKTTFFDCLFFLALFPLIEGLESLQASGILPVLFRLP